MRRIVIIFLSALVSVALWAGPVGASSLSSGRLTRSLELTGSFEGHGIFQLGPVPCQFLPEQLYGTYDVERRGVPDGSYSLSVCHSVPDELNRSAMNGTFTIAAGRRLTLEGTLAGFTVRTATDITLDLTLTVTGSTGGPALRGTITVSGFTQRHGVNDPTSDEHGTFTTDLHRVH